MSSSHPTADNLNRFRRRKRVQAGKKQRCCNRCETWKDESGFVNYGSYIGYVCIACRDAAQAARYRKAREARAEARMVFDDEVVSVYGLMVFASMPTPKQLIERSAA